MQPEHTAVEFSAVTARQQATWATGDFSQIARQVIPASDALCVAADPKPGQRVLDVACGSGNAALIAARRYCEVTGLDYVPALLETAKRRAEAEGTYPTWTLGDAQALPFEDSSFDVVLSVFGVMFAPDQERAAAELLRVCRPGGTLALANWMPSGFGMDFFGVHSRHAPPPAGVKPPLRWGTEKGLQELLGVGVSSLSTEVRTVIQYFRSVEHAVETFRAYFGPTSRAFSAVGTEGEKVLHADLTEVFSRYNRAADGTAAIECEYLLMVAKRAG